MSNHSVTIRGLRVVTTCWSWAWSNRTFPSKWVGLGSPLAACSVYGDLTCSVHTVNNLCMFNCQCHFYLCNRGPYVRLTFVPNMLSSWNKDIIIIIIIIIEVVFRSGLTVLNTYSFHSWFGLPLYLSISCHIYLLCERHHRETNYVICMEAPEGLLTSLLIFLLFITSYFLLLTSDFLM